MAVTNPIQNTPAVVLTVNGISPNFVIINGKTLGVGEQAEVPTPAGRVQVRCIEIKYKDNLVVVEVDGERKELIHRDQ